MFARNSETTASNFTLHVLSGLGLKTFAQHHILFLIYFVPFVREVQNRTKQASDDDDDDDDNNNNLIGYLISIFFHKLLLVSVVSYGRPNINIC